MRQVVHHVADSHLNSILRFKWTLTEDRPTIKPYFEDRWAELPDYAAVPVAASLELLAALHARWVPLLRLLTPTDLRREFVHPDSGTVRLDVNIGVYAWHGRHPLAHITGLAERAGWSAGSAATEQVARAVRVDERRLQEARGVGHTPAPVAEPQERRASWMLPLLGVLAGLVLVAGLTPAVYRPDRPVPTLVPGSSSGPAFVVQIIRPRLGLPLGGLLSPRLFGLETHLGFDSASAGAAVGRVGPRRLELRAQDWALTLVLDDAGRVAPETEVVFPLVFEDQLRRVRCRPGEPPVGTCSTTALPEPGELSGHFDVELARCEDADTGEPLGWPPKPLVLHGSFDRLVVTP